MFLYFLCGGLVDFIGVWYYLWQNVDIVWEYYQVFGVVFLQFVGDQCSVVFQYVGEGDQVSCMVMYNDVVFVVGSFDVFVVGKEMCWEFRGGYCVVG